MLVTSRESDVPVIGMEAATVLAARSEIPGIASRANPTDGARNQSSTAATGTECCVRTRYDPPPASFPLAMVVPDGAAAHTGDAATAMRVHINARTRIGAISLGWLGRDIRR